MYVHLGVCGDVLMIEIVFETLVSVDCAEVWADIGAVCVEFVESFVAVCVEIELVVVNSVTGVVSVWSVWGVVPMFMWDVAKWCPLVFSDDVLWYPPSIVVTVLSRVIVDAACAAVEVASVEVSVDWHTSSVNIEISCTHNATTLHWKVFIWGF